VLIGTLYPLFAEAMGDKISVGPPYFNKATAPLGMLIMLALLVGPMLRWRRDETARVKTIALIPAFAAVVTLIILWIAAPGAGVFPILGLGLAAALAIAAWLPLWGRNLRRTPLPIYGMVIAHFGLAVSVTGMASESGFSSETLAAMAPGESKTVAGWKVKLRDVKPVVGDNWVAIEGNLEASRGTESVAMAPQSRQFFTPAQQTNEAALLTRWDGQLYAVIAQPSGGDDQRWQVRLWWKPFVSLIWFGGILVACGGLMALLGRMLRRPKKPAKNPWSGQ
jgi:cytochrome c-type biogenesis protein CcmF